MRGLRTWIGLGFAMVLATTFSVPPGVEASAPYKIGFVTDLSGPFAESFTPLWEGFELYIKALNDRGGVNGHQVQVMIEDDRTSAARTVALAKKVVDDGAIAIFGLSSSSTHLPTYEEMGKLKIPVVTGFSGVQATLPPAKPYAYSAGTVFEVSGEVAGEILPAVVPKGSRVVGITVDTVGGRALLKTNKAVAEKLGYNWDEVVVPVRTVDFTPYALTLVSKRPDVVIGHYGAEQNIGVIPALRKAGFTGPYVVAVYGVGEHAVQEAIRKAGTGKNLYTFSRFISIFEDVPVVQRIKATAAKYGTTKPVSTMHVNGWIMAKIAETALKQCGWPCTGEKLDKVLSGLEIDTEGLTGGPIRFTATDHYGPSYWRVYRWDEAKEALVPVGEWLKRDKLIFPVK